MIYAYIGSIGHALDVRLADLRRARELAAASMASMQSGESRVRIASFVKIDSQSTRLDISNKIQCTSANPALNAREHSRNMALHKKQSRQEEYVPL